MKKSFAILLLVGLSAVASCAQFSRTNRIWRPCSATTTQARVEVQADGDIDLVPCSGRNVLINGVVTSNTLTVSGSSRTNYFPYFSTETNLAKSPFSWSGTAYGWNNTALNSESVIEFTPGIGVGERFRVGDFTTTPTVYLDVVQGVGGNVHLQATNNDFVTLSSTLLNSSADEIRFASSGGIGTTFTLSGGGAFHVDSLLAAFGDENLAANGTVLQIDDTSNGFRFNHGSSAGIVFFTGIADFQLNRTITAGGTTGNRTINKPAGTVNFAAAASALTVTNSTVNTSSIILATARTNDATCAVKNIVPAAGSFVITMTAACTAETSVGFLVLN